MIRPAIESAVAGEPRPWPDHPDVPGTADPASLPLDAFPPAILKWAESVSKSVQVPADVPCLLALACLSAACAGKVQVEVDEAWTKEWVTLYAVLVMAPAERKSEAFRLMTGPIQAWESEKTQTIAPRWREARELLDVADRRFKRLKDDAARGKATDDEVKAALRRIEEARRELPRLPALLAQDATPEALVAQMSEQGGRVAVFSPEGGPLHILAGRYSEGVPRLEELAQAYDGESLKTRRIGREERDVPRPALTLALALQPSVLETIRNGKAFRGQGIFGRIAWVRPPSLMGKRLDSSEVPPLDREAESGYTDLIRSLLDWFPPGMEDRDNPEPHVLRLSREATDVKREYHREVERALAPGGDLAGIRDWAGKAVGRAVRMAALLELAARASSGRPLVEAPISEWAMESGVAITRALTTHALAIYEELEADPHSSNLRYLLRRLKELPEGVTEAEFRSSVQGRASIRGADEVGELVSDLEARGCLRRIHSPPTGGPGRPRSQVLELHPSLRTDGAKIAKILSEGACEAPKRDFRNFRTLNAATAAEADSLPVSEPEALTDADRQYLRDEREGMQMEEPTSQTPRQPTPPMNGTAT